MQAEEGYSSTNGKSHLNPATSEGSASWAEFFEARGWVKNEKIHVPDESILELRFADGTDLLVLPHSGAGDMSPTVEHGIIAYRSGTDVHYYPWSALSSVVMKPNPRRSNARTVEREYVERRLVNSDDLIKPGQEPVRPEPEPEPETSAEPQPPVAQQLGRTGDPLRNSSLY